MFYFFRFNGSEFARTRDIFVASSSRYEFLDGMVKGVTALLLYQCERIEFHLWVVTEQLFSILLEGYVETLEAVTAKSVLRGEIGDVRL
jgi:hypothetical protein